MPVVAAKGLRHAIIRYFFSLLSSILISTRLTMELVADLKFILKSPSMWDHLREFGFIQEVTGKNVSVLKGAGEGAGVGTGSKMGTS